MVCLQVMVQAVLFKCSLQSSSFFFAVILPPERAAECQRYKVLAENGDPSRRNAKIDVSEHPENMINVNIINATTVHVRTLISFVTGHGV